LYAALLLALALVANPVAAKAQDPKSDAMEAALELFNLTSTEMLEQLSKGMIDQMWPLLSRGLPSNIDDGTKAELRKEFERIQIENLADVMKDAPGIYARHFTADELRELVAFYKSPIGIKVRKEMPKISTESISLIVPRMQEIQTKTANAFQRVMRERGYSK
jgi:hypothetical protein